MVYVIGGLGLCRGLLPRRRSYASPTVAELKPYSAARPKEKLELSSTLVAGFSLVSSSITYYTSCAYSNKTKNNGYWMGRGARALENPHTATGEESLEKLYALLDDLRGGGVRSQAFLSLQSKVSRNQTFDGPALFYAQLYPERKMSFSPLGARRSRGSGEGKKTHPLLHLARDDKERASSIDEQRIDEALGIALFFSPFLSVSSDPFVRNFFVRTESLAESNPVPQDPISAIHPPCIYAGDVASAMGFGLCR
ncbi:hypothetical protein V6N13_053609 [Hibiscus sabdariffa]